MGIIQTQVRIHFEIEMETHGQSLEIVEQTQIQLNPIDLALIDPESVPYQIVGPSRFRCRGGGSKTEENSIDSSLAFHQAAGIGDRGFINSS